MKVKQLIIERRLVTRSRVQAGKRGFNRRLMMTHTRRTPCSRIKFTIIGTAAKTPIWRRNCVSRAACNAVFSNKSLALRASSTPERAWNTQKLHLFEVPSLQKSEHRCKTPARYYYQSVNAQSISNPLVRWPRGCDSTWNYWSHITCRPQFFPNNKQHLLIRTAKSQNKKMHKLSCLMELILTYQIYFAVKEHVNGQYSQLPDRKIQTSDAWRAKTNISLNLDKMACIQNAWDFYTKYGNTRTTQEGIKITHHSCEIITNRSKEEGQHSEEVKQLA